MSGSANSQHVRVVDPRHEQQMHQLQELLKSLLPTGTHYCLVLIDGPETIVRKASWATSMTAQDAKNVFGALGNQIHVN